MANASKNKCHETLEDTLEILETLEASVHISGTRVPTSVLAEMTHCSGPQVTETKLGTNISLDMGTRIGINIDKNVRFTSKRESLAGLSQMHKSAF